MNRSSFEEQGWVLLPGLVDGARCDKVRSELSPHFDRRPAGRLLNAWEVSPAVRALATDPGVLAAAEEALGHRAVPFQTLDFRSGTEQDAHVDSLFFDTLPRGAMCGAWVALEDVDAGSGPLRLWPGTHRLAPLWADDLGDDDVAAAVARLLPGGLPEPLDVLARRGDVVLWAAGLLHGGAPVAVRDRTRWSQVTHYVAADHVYLSPLTSRPGEQRYMVRDQLVDIGTGRRVRQRLDGRPVVLEHGRGGLSRLHPGAGGPMRARLALLDLTRGAPRARRTATAWLRRSGRRLTGRPQWS